MRLELMVQPHRQNSPMSCWWTAMATVRAYYGRNYEPVPWLVHPEFRPSVNPSNGPYPRYQFPDTSRLPPDDPAAQLNSRDLAEQMTTDPSQWYWRGLPGRTAEMRQLLEITHFRGIGTSPRPGHWSIRDVAAVLRRCGPYIFLGQWNGYPHAVTVVGVDSGQQNVAYIDPAAGFVVSRPITAFNQTMGVRSLSAFENARLNPIYFPAPPQVRAVRWNDP